VGSTTYAPTARVEIARLRKDLDQLVERCEQIDPAEEARADAFRFAHLRLAGFLEQALMSAGKAVCFQMSGGQAQAFGLSWLERIRNPKAGEVVHFVERFDSDWACQLAEWLDNDERKSTLNALMRLRNDIAHGRSSGASASTFVDYYVVVYELVDWLLERFDPLPKKAAAS
jgi:HEPN superfamily RiboL-PSP-like protein